MILCALDDRSDLVLIEERHADELFAVIERNRARLREWLPWLDDNTEPAHTRAWARAGIEAFARGTQVSLAIRHQGALVGVCGLYGIDRANTRASVGYWLDHDAQGLGLMTRTVQALCRHAWDELGLRRLELRAATGNTRSRAVAERAGFRFEGVARDAERLYGRFVDHAVYARLSTDSTAGSA